MLRLRSSVVGLALLSGLWVGGCGSDSPTAPDIARATFASSLNIDLGTFTKTSDGLYYKDLVVGQGAVVASGQNVSVHYTGYFTDGTVFDSNGPSATPFGFQLGVGRVIEGWDLGIPGMRVGGQRELIIPPSLGYGSRDYLDIPGNSILVFIVTVVSAK